MWLLVLLIPLAAAQAPFVQDGRIVATIVVGESAPATDVILGAEVASYLQRSATEVAFGIAATSADISLSHPTPLILIGTPQNNPLVADQLGVLSDSALAGPVIDLRGDRLVLSGRTQDDVRTAVLGFIQGHEPRNTQPAQPDPVAQEVVFDEPVIEQPVAQEVVFDEPVQPQTQEPVVACDPVRYCRGAEIITVNAQCDEVVLRVCDGLCRDGECLLVETRPTAWQRFVSVIAFWRR